MSAQKSYSKRGATRETKYTPAWAGFGPSQKPYLGLTCPTCLAQQLEIPVVRSDRGTSPVVSRGERIHGFGDQSSFGQTSLDGSSIDCP